MPSPSHWTIGRPLAITQPIPPARSSINGSKARGRSPRGACYQTGRRKYGKTQVHLLLFQAPTSLPPSDALKFGASHTWPPDPKRPSALDWAPGTQKFAPICLTAEKRLPMQFAKLSKPNSLTLNCFTVEDEFLGGNITAARRTRNEKLRITYSPGFLPFGQKRLCGISV